MATKNKKTEIVKPEPKKTSAEQRRVLLKNGVEESAIPELARDSLRMIDLIFAAQRKKRAGAPTKGQVDYLVDEMGYKREDAIRFTWGECSRMIFKNKEARGLLRPRSAGQATA